MSVHESQGFSLIELMTVIAIFAVITAIAVPNYIRHRNNQQVTMAAREVLSALQAAKMTAIKDNATMHILFVEGKGASATYRVFEDLNGNNAFDDQTDRVVSGGGMPAGITMANAGFSGDAQAAFNSMGIPRQPNGALDFGSVEVGNGFRCNRIVLNASGSIRIGDCP